MAYPNTDSTHSQHTPEPVPGGAYSGRAAQPSGSMEGEGLSPEAFEEVYFRYRQKAHSLYSDAQVKELPRPFAYNVHKKTWEQKGKTLKRFVKYLKKFVKRRKEKIRILEVGCETGWFAHRLSRIDLCEVYGLDISSRDIAQARRVFDRDNLFFQHGDVFDPVFESRSFDMVILNDSLHHFPNVRQLLERCQYFLRDEGEIHLLESPLYKIWDIEAARADHQIHYEELKCEEMMDIHFYHTADDFYPFPFEFLSKPLGFIVSLKRRMGWVVSPHPWIRVRV